MNDEILKQLEAGVLAEKPGTNEHKIAMDALSKYIQTMSEVDKTEAELRMKQNSLDDDLTNKENELKLKIDDFEYRKQKDSEELKYRKEKDAADAIAEEKRSRSQKFMDIARTAITGIGLVVNTVLAVAILKENDDGKPIISNHGRALVNKVFRFKD